MPYTLDEETCNSRYVCMHACMLQVTAIHSVAPTGGENWCGRNGQELALPKWNSNDSARITGQKKLLYFPYFFKMKELKYIVLLLYRTSCMCPRTIRTASARGAWCSANPARNTKAPSLSAAPRMYVYIRTCSCTCRSHSILTFSISTTEEFV